MVESVYLETSVISALFDERDDPVCQVQHMQTQQWYDEENAKYDLFTSAIAPVNACYCDPRHVVPGGRIMSKDDGPIVEAVRKARTKILSECGYDFDRLAERLRKIEAEHAEQVRLPRSKDQHSAPAKQ